MNEKQTPEKLIHGEKWAVTSGSLNAKRRSGLRADRTGTVRWCGYGTIRGAMKNSCLFAGAFSPEATKNGTPVFFNRNPVLVSHGEATMIYCTSSRYPEIAKRTLPILLFGSTGEAWAKQVTVVAGSEYSFTSCPAMYSNKPPPKSLCWSTGR